MDHNITHEKKTHVEWDCKVEDTVLLRKDEILLKTESKYDSDPWTCTSVHTDRIARAATVQCGTKSECLNMRRVTPYFG